MKRKISKPKTQKYYGLVGLGSQSTTYRYFKWIILKSTINFLFLSKVLKMEKYLTIFFRNYNEAHYEAMKRLCWSSKLACNITRDINLDPPPSPLFIAFFYLPFAKNYCNPTPSSQLATFISRLETLQSSIYSNIIAPSTQLLQHQLTNIMITGLISRLGHK